MTKEEIAVAVLAYCIAVEIDVPLKKMRATVKFESPLWVDSNAIGHLRGP